MSKREQGRKRRGTGGRKNQTRYPPRDDPNNTSKEGNPSLGMLINFGRLNLNGCSKLSKWAQFELEIIQELDIGILTV